MRTMGYGFGAVVAMLIAGSAQAQTGGPLASEVDAVYGAAETLYRQLHQNPELSRHETRTAETMAAALRQAGFEVTTGVGGTGVVGILKNGAGPTVMLRTELDALPVTEATGLPFASTVRTKDDGGTEVGVMHACSHDLHMAAWVSAAKVMAGSRARWAGTLLMVAQPAEEIGAGAKAMMADGLLTRFPRPDYALAIHDDPRLPAGVVGYHAGPILTNSDSLNVTIFGRGGHGARPETTVDPVVIAAKIIIGLQTIVSRENSPFDPAVITVGSVHGGTKHNIIPDQVQLQLSVRSFTDAVRERLLAGIARVAKAEAAAAAAPREPLVEPVARARALVNDPKLTERIGAALSKALGPERVQDAPPEMVSEDFSEWQLAGIPTLMLRIGATERAKYDAATTSGAMLPSLHSAQFAPHLDPTLKAAISAELIALRTLLKRD
ncbi:MAG: amidohydrolase [Vicinamibacterales bacterium]